MIASEGLFGYVREWEPRNLDKARSKSYSVTPDVTQTPLQCIMCIYTHIHAVETQQLTDGISM
jgi:hypothetical protein